MGAYQLPVLPGAAQTGGQHLRAGKPGQQGEAGFGQGGLQGAQQAGGPAVKPNVAAEGHGGLPCPAVQPGEGLHKLRGAQAGNALPAALGRQPLQKAGRA